MGKNSNSRRSAWPVVLGVLLIGAVAGGVMLLRPADSGATTVPTWTVVRGPLRITVTEGGSLQSLKSTTVVSEVEGETKILAIVPEGAVVTAEDVAAGRVLVELDASSLDEKRRRQTITVSDAQSDVSQAVEAQKILQNQNESDLRKADLDVKFARIDLQKYLGAKVEPRVEEQVAPAVGEAGEGPGVRADVKALSADPDLEGEALQERRKREADIDLAKEEVARARDKLKWTEELLAKGYVSADEQVADRLALKRQEVALEQATTALSLFLAYEFPKQVERLASDLREMKETFQRVRRQTESSMTKSKAELKGKQEKAALETAELARIERQIAACVMKAKNPGLVVYASSEDRGYWSGEGSPIQQGASIRERQPILSIPDPKSLGVRINVHESALNKVKPEQTATVIVDAFADKPLVGHVIRMSALPSSANRWQNPDLKLYPTDVGLDEPPATLRPGMSAKVEILVTELENTLYVPVQAVTTSGGKPAVFVRTSTGDRSAEIVARPVKLGMSSDRFTQILDGVSDGDVVLLAPPKEQRPAGKPGDATGPGGKPRGDRTGKERKDGSGQDPKAAPGSSVPSPSPATGAAAPTPPSTSSGGSGAGSASTPQAAPPGRSATGK